MDSMNLPQYDKKGKLKFDDQTPFWTRMRYKYLSMYFLKRAALVVFRLVLLIGISYVVIFPYISKLSSSFMSREDFVDVSVKLIPKYPTLDTYKAIINDNKYFEALTNTALVSVACGLIQMMSCALVGYGFSKFNFKGKGFLFACVILTMVVPHKTLQFSMKMAFQYFDIWGIGGFLKKAFGGPDSTAYIANMYDTHWPLLILSFGAVGFKNGLYIFIMRQYYKGVPDELEEAAYVDGAGTFKTFIRIILPMSVPMLVTIFLLSFSWQWTDNFYVTMFYNAKTNVFFPQIVNTIPKSLDTKYVAQAAYETAIRNTSGILVLAPLVVVFLFGQRYLIQGIERTGVTG